MQREIKLLAHVHPANKWQSQNLYSHNLTRNPLALTAKLCSFGGGKLCTLSVDIQDTQFKALF